MSARVAIEAVDLDPARRRLEVVECKGAGHPDSLCDAAAEAFSRGLSRHYLEIAGRVLHHNVDKALLVAGRTEARFGGGRWLDPIELTLAGRATTRLRGREVPVEEIGRAAAREALGAVRHLDPADPTQLDVRVTVRPGEVELTQVFDAASKGPPRAGDTSIGVGFAPATPTEQLTRALDAALRRIAADEPDSPFGEDTKLMVVRDGDSVQLTLAVAMVARRVADAAAYRHAVSRLHELALAEARRGGFEQATAFVNAADEPGGSFYLTVSGTSAECGDDGQVGRGNRTSGLITPMRAMTLEAYAGKNPTTHVGKLLSVAAERIAARCAELPDVRSAECVLVSRIGAPVSEPQRAGVCLDAPEARCEELRDAIEECVRAELARVPDLWEEIVGASR